MRFPVPLEIIVHWPEPNYVNPQTRGLPLTILSAIFTVFAAFCVIARLYGRIFVRRWFGLDDLLVLVGWISSIGVMAVTQLGVWHYDWDKHLWDMRPQNWMPAAKALFSAIILWSLASACIRLSILCLYHRILRQCHSVNERYHLWAIYGLVAYTCACLLVNLGTCIFSCVPVRAAWTFTDIPGQKCINYGLAWMIGSILNTFAEFFVAAMPVIATYTLQVDSRQRWHVIGLLSLGYIVTITGCVRCYYIWKVVHTYDISWWAIPQWICSDLEIDLAIICACVAPLRPLAGRFFNRMRDFSGKVSSQNQASTILETQRSQSTQQSTLVGESTSGKFCLDPTYRCVDLEGIGLEDGLGYTVTITGPAVPSKSRVLKKRRSSRKHSDSIKIEMEKGVNYEGSPQKIQIETVQTYAVDEDYRDVSDRPPQYQFDTQMAPEAMEREIDEASVGLSIWGLLDAQTSMRSPSERVDIEAPLPIARPSAERSVMRDPAR